MEVVSNSNLVSLENEKITANPGHKFFCCSWLDERPNRKWCIYANMKLFLASWYQNCEKRPKKHIHKSEKSKPTSNKRKNLFYFENALFFCNNLIRAKIGW